MYFLNIIILCFLFLQTFGRPTHVLQDYDKDSKETYRDDDSGNSDDYLHSEQKSSLKQFAGNEPVSKAELQKENNIRTNEEVGNVRLDKDYLENDVDHADAAELPHEVSMGKDNKITAAYNNGNMLYYENEKLRNVQSNEYNDDDNIGSSPHTRYLKQYNTVRTVGRETIPRDRRQIKNHHLNENIGNEEISTQKNELSADEDEETAIRRHVKRLSKEELDELVHSLSEDKRTLLKSIIDNCQQNYDSINKREITKKAGASGENSLVGNEQSDTSKIQESAANLEAESSLAPDSEKEDSTKKTDTESMYSKSTENANSSEKTNEKISVLGSITEKKLESDSKENLESSETESKILENPGLEKETSKKENKREVNSKSVYVPESIIDDPGLLKTLNKEDSYCSENVELSQLWNEESSLYNDNNKFKRQLCHDDLSSIKSLEESFPSLESPNNLKPGSDMAPLVRVKRNHPDKLVEKRDTDILSNLKTPYFSSAVENNEEGNDEGGEFQGEGIFDKGVNYAKSSELTKQGTIVSGDNGKNNIQYCGNSQLNRVDKNKLENDNVGLGSDTDVVLSGIEGVDDNMMYNSVARVRRTGVPLYNQNMENETGKCKQERKQMFVLQNEDNEISKEDDAARYQENDSFGSLPRNYAQDLGRFKRIRRLKPETNAPITK